MLTDQFNGSEIALGIQLKHIAARTLANRTTQSYAAADPAWAEHLESAIDAGRFRRIKDLYQAQKDGRPIGFGPAAARVTNSFDEIQSTAAARGCAARVEESNRSWTRLATSCHESPQAQKHPRELAVFVLPRQAIERGEKIVPFDRRNRCNGQRLA